MAKKFNASQFKSKVRQLENKQRQAINNYNNAIRKYNRDMKQAVNQYNNAVRQHNARVRQNRAKIESELRRLNSQPMFRVTTTYTSSVRLVNSAYNNVAAFYDTLPISSDFVEQFYSDVEQENSNCLETANVILANDPKPQSDYSLQDTKIMRQLNSISEDLDNRWKGALFSLNPLNPDATRHFCTSAREIFTEIFNLKAPDKIVAAKYPDCEKTQNGTPTRRAKIHFFLDNKGISNSDAVEFVETDIQNILELFHVLSDGTHGAAGRYSIGQLQAIKARVEDGLLFLCNIAA